MSTFFNTIHITNFKSLKDVTLSDCKRINLLIGKPNVGKSNILEAIGLFSLPYIKYNKSKKLTQFIRLENLAELFFDGNIEEKATIKIEDSYCILNFIKEDNTVEFDINLKDERTLKVKEDIISLDYSEAHTISANFKLSLIFKSKNKVYLSPRVRYYKFPHKFEPIKTPINQFYLMPPSGINLFDIVEDKKIKNDLSSIFNDCGLKLLFDKTNNTLRLMKPLKEDDAIVSFPYSSIADTLQRVIFFKTAIASNNDSILLFEEPEAHCFPPYITHIAREIIDSESNQFFIATHSPFILDTFLENSRNDLAIFMADFKDGQTVIKRLTDGELNDVYEYGLDLFFNSELFTDEI